jgi:hypothetical protein
MIVSAPPQSAASIPLLEGGLTLIAVAFSFAWPGFCGAWFTRIENACGQLARRRGLAVIVVGLSVPLLRLAILPLLPIPLPVLPDDFSFLLSGDTFAHGRLSNPTPAMWIHFESIQIDMKPTYVSMYFPGQGMALAAGNVLFGHPWFGLLAASAFMCAAICWMLQAWLPPAWALLGGMLAVVRLGVFSYWINTYTGGGLIAALGGALLLGALPRFMRTARQRYSLLMTVGIVLLAITRPYEGILLCIPIAIALGRWLFFDKDRPSTLVLLQNTWAPMALMIAAGAWMGYYDYRAFGSPQTPPYSVNRATYAITPYYVWQPLRPDPVYRHEVLRRFYHSFELAIYNDIHTIPGFFSQSFNKAITGTLFFSGIALIPPLIMLRRVLLDRRIRFLVLCVAVLSVGMIIEVFLAPHYIAPFTAAFYAIGLQAMRHLWHWSPGSQKVGRTIVRLTVTLCILMAGLRSFDRTLQMPIHKLPISGWVFWWIGPDHFGQERAEVEGRLEQIPGGQLAIVRYSLNHDSMNEWVYNAAQIDDSKVIWARDMDAGHNLELIHHYPERNVWLVQPDEQPATVSPYPMP